MAHGHQELPKMNRRSPESRNRGGHAAMSKPRRLCVQMNRSDLHSGITDVVSLALIVSHMGCIKTQAAPARIKIEAVSAD